MERANYYVRRGFFSTFVQSVCAVIVVVLLCVTALGLYSIRVVSHKLDGALNLSTNLVASLPEVLPKLQESLPPALADAVHDERMPQYRDSLELAARVVPGDRRGGRVIVEVANNGEEVVSLLAVRVNVHNAGGSPVRELASYVATPLMIDNDLRGPLMPHSKRQCVLPIWGDATGESAAIEIADLRVWQQKDADPAVASRLPERD